jgi:hypothetical protein
MNNVTALNFSKQAVDKANVGQLSQFALNEVMQHIATVCFGGDLAKMLEVDRFGRPTNEFGKIFLAPRTGRVSYAEQAALMKSEGYKVRDPNRRDDGSTGGMSVDHNQRPSRVSTGATANEDNDQAEDDADTPVSTSTNRRDTKPRQASFTRKIQQLVKSGMNFDQACTALLKRGG